MEELDILANNLANTSSQGYKSDREMYGLYASGDASGSDEGAAETQPWIKSTWMDFSQGTTSADRQSFGSCFGGKRISSGPRFLRHALYPQRQFESDANRRPARGGRPRGVGFQRQSGKTRSHASLSHRSGWRPDPSGNTVAQLSVVEFSDPHKSLKAGQSYFRTSSGVVATPAVATEVHQGQLEESNAGPAEGAVRLVSVMRQFEMLQKAITLGAEMDKQAIAEVAKVNP